MPAEKKRQSERKRLGDWKWLGVREKSVEGERLFETERGEREERGKVFVYQKSQCQLLIRPLFSNPCTFFLGSQRYAFCHSLPSLFVLDVLTSMNM